MTGGIDNMIYMYSYNQQNDCGLVFEHYFNLCCLVLTFVSQPQYKESMIRIITDVDFSVFIDKSKKHLFLTVSTEMMPQRLINSRHMR